jgi:hypothetical protein
MELRGRDVVSIAALVLILVSLLVLLILAAL